MLTRRFHQAAALFVVALLATGCTRDSPLEPDEPVVGNYELTAVAGSALPLVVHEDAEQVVELVSGSLVLRTDGTFTEVFNYLATPRNGDDPEETADELAGTYSVSGRTVSFVSAEGSWQANASDGTISYNIGNVPLLFEL